MEEKEDASATSFAHSLYDKYGKHAQFVPTKVRMSWIDFLIEKTSPFSRA